MVILKLNSGSHWCYESSSPANFSIFIYDDKKREQWFRSLEPDSKCDLNMFFNAGDTITIQFYENGSPEPIKTKTINFEISSLSVSEHYNPLNVKYFPNPTTEKLFVELKVFGYKEIKTEIYDYHGHLANQSVTQYSKVFEIETHSLKKGCYLARIVSGNNKPQTIRFIKN